MPENASLARRAAAFGKAIAFVLLAFVSALTIAVLSSAAICLSSMRLHLRLADFTCGHNAIYPLGLFFVVLLPIVGFTLPQVPRAVSDAIYGRVQGAVYDTTQQFWTLPCGQLLNISFNFGGVNIPIHPLDSKRKPFAAIHVLMYYLQLSTMTSTTRTATVILLASVLYVISLNIILHL